MFSEFLRSKKSFNIGIFMNTIFFIIIIFETPCENNMHFLVNPVYV